MDPSSSSQSEDAKNESEELESFDDFTLASSWERLISEIEAVCRMWHSDGPKNLLAKGAKIAGGSKDLYSVKAEITSGKKTYFLEFFFNDGKKHATTDYWRDRQHFLQLWFGVEEFLIMYPQSLSGVLLDAPEATRLLSAVAIALSSCGSVWPVFVPVHDPTRKAYKGIQISGVSETRRFEVDRIGSQVPVKIMHLEGLYELFVSKLVFMPWETSSPMINVHYTMRLTYKTPVSSFDMDTTDVNEYENLEVDNEADRDPFKQLQWDDNFRWSEWYSAEDPIKGFELIALWLDREAESSVEMAELENVSAFEADKWFIMPLIASERLDSDSNDQVNFASRILTLVSAYRLSFEAQFLDEFATAENLRIQKITTSDAIPPPSVLDRILKDLFHEDPSVSCLSDDFSEFSSKIKGAPLDSLFTQFCLHSLWFGSCNIRAIAVLWTEFVREVRWCWEELQPLPRMPVDNNIDLSCCLVHQKLQMLALCIKKKGSEEKKYGNEKSSQKIRPKKKDGKLDKHLDSEGKETSSEDILHHNKRGRSSAKLKDNMTTDESANNLNSYRENSDELLGNHFLGNHRRGSLGPVENIKLLRTFKSLHKPCTQDIPPMTQDMHEERQQAIEAMNDSINGGNIYAQLEKEILASDMAAFKAANPDCIFEDFIRWHSPGDWIECDAAESLQCHVDESIDSEGKKDGWPSMGRLSERMSEPGNSWHQIWDSVHAIPASEQRPLFDCNREGEKVLHYLETLRPHQLLNQMICTAFRGAADTLSKTDFGTLPTLVTRIQQLYCTLASTLRSLQGENCKELLDDNYNDMKELCSVFNETEYLILFGASLHQKLQHVHRIEAAIFNDYLIYTQKVKQNSKSDENIFAKHRIRVNERNSIILLFPSPSVRQSWRKVLTMGNKLNGHEPLSREVKFFFHEKMNMAHYGNIGPETLRSNTQIHSMYVFGTSNDLQIAFSTTYTD